VRWLVLVLALVVPASAAAATTKLDQQAIDRIARGDSRMAEVQRVHPLAVWTATYRKQSATWIARLREPSRSILATVTVRDRDSVVTAARVNPGALDTHLLTQSRAERIAGTSPKVRDWMARYARAKAKVTSSTSFENGAWVRHWWADGAEVARVLVDDKTGAITAAWTGPQVAWSMARGSKGAFGRRINEPWIFGPLLLLFAAGLFDWRKILSLRNLDLLALASFTVSLWYFNEGLVFWSVPLQYPPLVYLFVRLVAIGSGRARRSSYTTRWPVWLVAGLAVFALGFRAGLNFWSSNVIDVGYASVAGSDRLLSGSIPYDHMPKVTATPCGPKYSDGSYSAYKQASGACESPVERGDTYGPVMYYAYAPATAALGWSGRWDDLPAAHGTAVAFDALAAAGLAFAGWRMGRGRLAATLLFCWATFPFTTYAMSSNSNDAVIAAFVAWAIAVFSFPFLRGLMLGFGAWAKFAPLLLVPLFLRAGRRPAAEPPEWGFDAGGPPLLRQPGLWQRLVRRLGPGPGGGRFLLGLASATVVAFGVLVVLDGPSALGTFWTRTFGWQLDRPSPFSVWDWGDYPGFPDLAVPQKVLKAGLVALAVGLYFVPRRLDPVRAAAFAGALLIGFQIVLTHWFYLYIPWFMPCVAVALYAGRPGLAPERVAAPVPLGVAVERRDRVPGPLAHRLPA
jgi:hypothetical protein